LQILSLVRPRLSGAPFASRVEDVRIRGYSSRCAASGARGTSAHHNLAVVTPSVIARILCAAPVTY
ncbi:MAG: hypothetical protein WA669_11030, partial [Pseudolabrys sp.]